MKYLVILFSAFVAIVATIHYARFKEDNTKIHIEIWCSDKTRMSANGRGIPNFTDRIYIVAENGIHYSFSSEMCNYSYYVMDDQK